jgi:hypothetical protein
VARVINLVTTIKFEGWDLEFDKNPSGITTGKLFEKVPS